MQIDMRVREETSGVRANLNLRHSTLLQACDTASHALTVHQLNQPWVLSIHNFIPKNATDQLTANISNKKHFLSCTEMYCDVYF